ncbi:hypothetical protein W97_07123 [Coniosporium apollinis CBS 100218]|uniref:Major facilitator superfamily (MFS) profile domain-containing protein n=1 Tax=Coniosporium apollinis (strain CBS 100218) TaxID=1168221 RepID=R7Z1E8_CONA1|nr:uncharacterized protein W97_07123 [Coniosporium apollinis CBS 100218]EON67977.1 hypothetical protein W97_07123 [Coniosporium apollinis CBS 100218]
MAGFKYAFSLSEGEVESARPPGTVVLIDHHLQRTTSGREVQEDTVVLNPQPSLDPADPLNWAPWRKTAMLVCVSAVPLVANFTSSSIASAFPVLATPLAFNPPVPITRLTQLISVNVLMQGASNFLWVPLANTFGRRPIMLISLLMLVFFSMWAGLAKDFSSLLAARFFMGFSNGPADTIAPDIIGEIYFVHQRGRAMAIYTVCLACGPLLGGIAGGYIVGGLGIAWIHWVNVILAAITLILCFLFQPETLFDRTATMGIAGNSSIDHSSETKPKVTELEEVAFTTDYRPYTFARSLKMNTYRGGVLQKFIAPFLTLRLPGVWLIMFWYAGLVGGVVTISAIGPTIVASPPYLWGHDAGLINVGALIGALVGLVFTYITVDRSIKQQAKHESHGLGEPETRLKTALPGLFLATAGLLVFGFCAANPSPKGWVGLQVGYGMVSFGLMQCPSVGFNYLIEAYNAISGDCFVAVTSCRAIIAFAWTFFVGTWVHDRGAAEPFGIFGMLMGLFALFTFPILIWGKRLRIATAKWLPAHADH